MFLSFYCEFCTNKISRRELFLSGTGVLCQATGAQVHRFSSGCEIGFFMGGENHLVWWHPLEETLKVIRCRSYIYSLLKNIIHINTECIKRNLYSLFPACWITFLTGSSRRCLSTKTIHKYFVIWGSTLVLSLGVETKVNQAYTF